MKLSIILNQKSMKKIFLLLAISIFITSCIGEGPEGIQGPPGPGTNWKIVTLKATNSGWKGSTDIDKLNLRYSCHFDMPEITPFVYSSGSVVTYLTKSNSQQILPYVQHYESSVDRWTTTIDYEYSVGGLDVYVTNSDFALDPPGTMDFRVVITY